MATATLSRSVYLDSEFEVTDRPESAMGLGLPPVSVSIGPQQALLPVVTLRAAGASVIGFADRVMDSEIVVQALEELSPVRGTCSAVVDFGGEYAWVFGAVSRLDDDARLLRLSIDRIDGGGELLLAAELLSNDAGADSD